jgi:hypothetical protein
MGSSSLTSFADAKGYSLISKFEPVELSFRKDGTLYVRDEFGKRANIYAETFVTGGERLDERSPAADVRIEYEVARLGERLNCSTAEHRRKSGSIFVDGVTGAGLPSKEAALASALYCARRAASLEGRRPSLTWMV